MIVARFLAGATSVLAAASLAACNGVLRPDGRYLVTATPFQLIAPGHPGFCIAVDSSDTKGVWWWEPGRSGCSSRSTGPEVFRADRARVMKGAATIDVQFEIQLMKGDPLQLKFTADSSGIRREPTGERVTLQRRRDLDLPESCCAPSSR